MNGLYTILLLVLSNIFMTLAWYGHLKLQQTGVSSNWPLIGVIAFLGYRLLRILLSGTSQPHRFRG